ncbi:holdfast anchoring protein HfaB [Ponticaulis profundi]|uniref:Holdfast anchoring protein HfaB n=1 Tax=Ponticaulis profundi TaxID=2665222 RepID=A0ABW1S504_9PROT
MTNQKNLPKRPAAKLAALAAASMLALAGCVSPVAGPTGKYATPIGSAPVTANPTPYSTSLSCLASFAGQNQLARPRIAVGRILDYTGKADLEGGRKVTQGASLMAISAFAKAGVSLVERFDTSVSELELKYANNKLITDDGAQFREILAGSIPGSDFYLVGGITELNYNIRSVGVEAFAGDTDAEDLKGTFGNKMYVINVGLDLRLVETQTLEVVDVISYQKQIIGREISFGVFDFLNGNVFDIGAGGRAQEPIQLAVRSVIERAVVEMTANLYGIDGPTSCLGEDPLGTSGVTGGFIPLSTNIATNNAETRAEPARWNENRDKALKSALRGRQ